MKIDWFRGLVIVSIIVLLGSVFYMSLAYRNYPHPEVDLSPYTGVSSMEAWIFGLKGNKLEAQWVELESSKQDRFRVIMQAYEHTNLTRVESLVVNDVYEENNRIYLDVSKHSFSHPGVTPENIRLHVQAIVNSLTANDRELPVQFLFDGGVMTEPIEELSFQLPFGRDETEIYDRNDIEQLVSEFLEQIEQEKYAQARKMIYLSPEDRLTESELMHKLRTYRQAKKSATPRQIEIFTEGSSYLAQVHFVETGRPEHWNVAIINKMHYIMYINSPLDR